MRLRFFRLPAVLILLHRAWCLLDVWLWLCRDFAGSQKQPYGNKKLCTFAAVAPERGDWAIEGEDERI